MTARKELDQHKKNSQADDIDEVTNGSMITHEQVSDTFTEGTTDDFAQRKNQPTKQKTNQNTLK